MANPHRYTIMVVDDDEALQLFVHKILEDQYDVITAVEAGEAISLLTRNLVDLVVLDLMLPGVSGLSLCREIKELGKDRRVPIIVLTSRTDLETKVEALEAGADDYITKPFHEKELLIRIKVQLRIKDLHRELIKTERLKAIVETAISANHEINNPLCAILTNAELIMALPHIQGDPEAMTFLTHIFNNAQRIEKTIQKMANLIQPVISEYLPGISMLDLTRSEAKRSEFGSS